MKESGIVHGWDLSFGMNNVKKSSEEYGQNSIIDRENGI